MADRYDIESFLIDFKFKLDIFGILFRDDRSKNAHTLAILEITPNDRIKILRQLKIEDYSEGPIAEKLYNNADMWVFGTKVKGYEISL